MLERVQVLTVVHADLGRIPTNLLPKKTAKDGKLYWVLRFALEITYLSAFTKYELIHNGVNYGPVYAEYV